MNLRRLPSHLLVTLGLTACGPSLDPSSEGTEGGRDSTTSTGAGTTRASTTTGHSSLGTSGGSTTMSTTTDSTTSVEVEAGPCLSFIFEPDLGSTGGESGSGSSDSGGSSGSGGSDSGGESGEERGPGCAVDSAIDREAERSRAVEGLHDRGILPDDLLVRLRD